MKKYCKLLIFNFLIVLVFGPGIAAFKLHSMQKYGNLSFSEYYTLAWIKLGLFFLIVFIGGCIVCGLIEKNLEKHKQENLG